ncbi:MAG: hypothetical protein V7701_17775, partial [Sneathiella sp.]
PGFIGAMGSILGNAEVNIATFHLGRDQKKGEAIALIEIDSELSKDTMDMVCKLPQVTQVKALNF